MPGMPVNSEVVVLPGEDPLFGHVLLFAGVVSGRCLQVVALR